MHSFLQIVLFERRPAKRKRLGKNAKVIKFIFRKLFREKCENYAIFHENTFREK